MKKSMIHESHELHKMNSPTAEVEVARHARDACKNMRNYKLDVNLT
jgi:hypothetical protein